MASASSSLKLEGRAELLDREAEVAHAEQRRAEQRVRARRERVDGDDARGVVVGVAQVALLEQRVAQAEPRARVPRVFREQLAVDLLRVLELALAQARGSARARALACRRRRLAPRNPPVASAGRQTRNGGHNSRPPDRTKFLIGFTPGFRTMSDER